MMDVFVSCGVIEEVIVYRSNIIVFAMSIVAFLCIRD